jgi:hypothetical protein
MLSSLALVSIHASPLPTVGLSQDSTPSNYIATVNSAAGGVSFRVFVVSCAPWGPVRCPGHVHVPEGCDAVASLGS